MAMPEKIEEVPFPDKYTKMELNSYEGEEPYIFISYSHRDTDVVYPVLRLINREKYRFWFDDTMEIGEDFREELRVRIEKCSAFILFVSDASMNSKYCCMEVIHAFKYNKKIYPIYLNDNVKIPTALTMVLENLQHVKGITNHDTDKYVNKLIAGLPIETMRSLQTEDDVLVKCKDGSRHVAIPAGISTIGVGAFKNCEKLERVTFGDEVKVLQKEAFRGCKSIKSIVLPANIKKVGDSAFRDCISMTSLVCENPKIELGERAFENCPMLTEITLNDGLTEIYGGVFNSCKALTSIKLPAKLTVLGENAFADCASLQSIDIPEPVTKLDDMVFNGCIKLEEVKLKNKVTKIGKNAFKDCKSLRRIEIPQSVTSIGAGIFRGCDNLEIIAVDPKNKSFKTLNGVLFNKNKSVLICHPAKVGGEEFIVPDSVTEIGDWAFCECLNLKKIEIPDSVYEIGEGAFYSCSSLEEIVLPDSVTKIDDTAFRGCTALKRVVIPDSVQEFGWGIFSGCEEVVIICGERSAAAKYCNAHDIPHRTH